MSISLYSASLSHINSTYTENYNLFDLYIIFLVFCNGTYFNKMAVENYMCIDLIFKIDFIIHLKLYDKMQEVCYFY